jgi:hypothetical protein
MHRSKTHFYREKIGFYDLLDMLYHLERSNNNFEKKIFYCEKLVFQKPGLWRRMGKCHSDIRNQHS